MTKKLQKQIDAFLKDRRKSKGGYAPVEDGDIEKLRNVIVTLLELKWQRDPDRDLPVEYSLIDRTRGWLPACLDIPHPYFHNLKTTGEMFDHLELIAAKMNRLSELMNREMETLQQTLKRENKAVAN